MLNQPEVGFDALQALEGLGRGVLVVAKDDADAKPRIIYANRIAEKLIGWKHDRLVDQCLNVVNGPHRDERLENAVEEVFCTGTPWTGQGKLSRCGGECVEAEWLVSGFQYDQKGNPTRVVAMITCNDRRYCLDKPQWSAMINAENAFHARKRYLSRISHKVRTPLNAMVGFSDIMLMSCDNLTSEQITYLKLIRQGAEDLQYQVRRITDFSYASVGTHVLTDDVHDMNDFVGDCVREYESDRKDLGINISTSWGEACPIILDCVKMKLALHEVISHAVRYSEPGDEVRVQVSRRHDGAAIVVSDDRVLIDSSTLDGYINNAKVQDVTPAVAENLIGLELIMPKCLVEQHGGQLLVRSAKGLGTTVEIKLPNWRVAEGELRLLEELRTDVA